MTLVTDYTALISGSSWSSVPVQSAFLTYSFSGLQDYMVTEFGVLAASTVEQFSSDLQAVTRLALDNFEAVSGLKFIEVPGQADMQFQWINFNLTSQAGFSGFAYYPGKYDLAGDVFLNNAGSISALMGLLLHEIGHAVGLKHPHDGDINLTPGLDNTGNTVMSYQGSLPPSLGSFDLAALQSIYGSAESFASHLSSWTWDGISGVLTQVATETSEAIDGTAVRDLIITYGGNDTINGGAGDDSLWAGTGEDSVEGGLGDDVIGGGAGNDMIDGGAGNNTVFGGQGDDEVWSRGNDVIWSGSGNDVIWVYVDGSGIYGLGAGNDTVYGNIGDDTIYGGADDGSQNDDLIFSDNGSDVVYAGSGDDSIYGGLGGQLFFGGAGGDYLVTGPGNDTLWGGAGNDRMNGGEGADLFGFAVGSGQDVIYDFNAIEGDRLDLQGQSYSTNTGGGSTVLNLSGGGTLTLEGVSTFDENVVL